MSVLVAAYNEEKEIGDRIVNALKQDYPPGMLEVVIASDGSSDRTNEIAAAFAGYGVRLLDYPVRRGKATVLNDAFGELDGEVVVLSDANTYFSDPGVVRKLARWFRDPAVGAVCGKLVLTDPETGTNVDGVYWKYETFLKQCESRLGALLGSNGAIYAIRRELFDGIPPGTVLDDFVIPLLARMRTGKRIVYDPEARADEETPKGIGQEFKRRARIGAGGFQSHRDASRAVAPPIRVDGVHLLVAQGPAVGLPVPAGRRTGNQRRPGGRRRAAVSGAVGRPGPVLRPRGRRHPTARPARRCARRSG